MNYFYLDYVNYLNLILILQIIYLPHQLLTILYDLNLFYYY
jgi:hypothetical protein